MDTIFYPGTVVTSEWLNDINKLNYTVFDNPSNISDVVTQLISEGILSSISEPGTGGGGSTVLASATFDTHTITATGGETLIPLPFSYTLNGKTLFVYINGLLQYPSTHYTETSVSSVTFTEALVAGDVVRFVGNVISSAYIPEQAALAAIYALTPAANKFIYFTDGTTADLADVTAFARTLLDDADAATARATLGISSAITTEVSSQSLGVDQTWVNVLASRTTNVSYRNTTGKPIMVNITFINDPATIQISTNNSTWVTAATQVSGNGWGPFSIIVPNNHYYKLVESGGTLVTWTELR